MKITARTWIHPRTRRFYTFPKDARRYRALVYRMREAWWCEHGHLDCAAWERGPCVSEVAGHLDMPDAD